MIGKVPRELLEAVVLSRSGAQDSRVLQGPAYGEDAAAIRLGEDVLVVSPDPISMAVGRVGTLGINVACNDVAASGATPEWLTAVVFLPDDDEATLETVMTQLDEAATALDVAIVGGHTEYAPALEAPMVVLTCMGLTDRFVPTGGAEPGDRLLLTKAAGIEATAILATDFRDRLLEAVDPAVLDRAESFYADVGVVPEAETIAPDAHAMHDPTEGGLVDGALEMAVASGVTLEIDPSVVPVREETAVLCRTVDVDPLRVFGSGALLAAVPEAGIDAVTGRLDDRGIDNAVIGTVRDAAEPALRLGDERLTEPVRDEMYALWE